MRNDAYESGVYVSADDDNLTVPECDCDEHGDRERNESRYFNPCWENYKGESPEDIRKYIRQDYERMERLHRGGWCYLGIRAEAEILLPLEMPASCKRLRPAGCGASSLILTRPILLTLTRSNCQNSVSNCELSDSARGD